MTNFFFEKVVRLEQIQGLGDFWSPASLCSEILNQHSEIWVLANSMHRLGCVLARWDGLDRAEILQLWVQKAFRRQGLGMLLLEKSCQELIDKGVQRIFLEVRVANDPAKILYQRFGFQVLVKRKGFYSSGDDAWSMVLQTDSLRFQSLSKSEKQKKEGVKL